MFYYGIIGVVFKADSLELNYSYQPSADNLIIFLHSFVPKKLSSTNGQMIAVDPSVVEILGPALVFEEPTTTTTPTTVVPVSLS